MFLIRNKRKTILEKTVRFKKNYSENKDSNRGCKVNKNNKRNNKNRVNGNPEFSNEKRKKVAN